jgi:peptidoglycan/LPS O-acetylase OafA/YrhL
MPIWGELSPARNNNFNLLRMIAATAVLVSHAFPLALGSASIEPLQQSLGISLGTLSVCSFFVISGYFVSQSFHRKHQILEFIAARVLRIYPGLLAALILTVLIVGPVFTNLSLGAYFARPETLLYIPRNLSLARLQDELPAVFNGNPYPGAINGSLWTLVYEVGCYVMVVGVGLSGLAANGRRFAGFITGYAAFYLAITVFGLHSPRLQAVCQLSLPFVTGMAFFQYRRRFRFRPVILIGMAGIAFCSYGRPWFAEVFIFAWAYVLLFIGFLRVRPLQAYNHLGDYSYGMYIYAFPVEQMVATLAKGCTPLALTFWAFVPTLGLAVLSWHLIERRAIAQRAALAVFLRGNRAVMP